MKVVHLNTETSKASANVRIHLALRDQGIDSKIVVLNHNECIEHIYQVKKTYGYLIKSKILRNCEFFFLRLIYPKSKNLSFSYGMYGADVLKNKYVLDADIIHLHWINSGFISIRTIKKLIKMGKHIVWTLHDSWPITGGCHVRDGCNRFEQQCGNCSMLESKVKFDLTYCIMQYKKNAFRENNIFCVAPSKWMYHNIIRSNLFKDNRCVTIPNAIDTSIFAPHAIETIEDTLQYKKDDGKYYILFGAMESIKTPYKGFAYLAEVLEMICIKNQDLQKKIVLHIFGADSCNISILSSYECKYWGHIYQEEKLACLYDLADVYVFPSIDDNLPSTVMESLSCQTPVVAFNTGGVPDMVEHFISGYIAKQKDVQDLYEGLLWVFQNNINNMLGKNGRTKVKRDYNNKVVASSYIKIYEELLESESKRGDI